MQPEIRKISLKQLAMFILMQRSIVLGAYKVVLISNKSMPNWTLEGQNDANASSCFVSFVLLTLYFVDQY